jgi:hypothetical protein
MIEELCEFLNRYGWDESIAADIHDAYYNSGFSGVEKYIIENLNDDKHNYLREVFVNIEEWEIEAGEKQAVKKRIFVIKH